jgi:DNA-binding CsgD family transcriptional regulator
VLAALDAQQTQPGARGVLILEGDSVIETAGIGDELTDGGSDPQYSHSLQGPPLAHLRLLAKANPRFSTIILAGDGSWIGANGTDLGNGRVAVLLAAVTPAELLGAKVVAAGLTGREVEVTRLLCRGLTDGEIAAELFLSPHTVHDHVRAIRRKLQVRSRAGVASHVFSEAYFDAFLAGAAVAHGD